MRSKKKTAYKMSYYDYESARDKYYEEEDYCCECYYPQDEPPCDYCTERAEKIAAVEAAIKKAAEKERATGWPVTRAEIKRRMTAIDPAADLWLRINAFELLFKYLLNHCGAFMAATPRFRAAVIEKLDELSLDDRTHDIRSTMESLRAMIVALEERPDFVAPK